jgi:hypothetical protein
MPRYFFHVMDGKAFIDDVGTDLPDLKAAQLEAVRTAAELLVGSEIRWSGSPWRMSVTDDSRNILYSLEFSATKHGD